MEGRIKSGKHNPADKAELQPAWRKKIGREKKPAPQQPPDQRSCRPKRAEK
jgi:hypothetical protein